METFITLTNNDSGEKQAINAYYIMVYWYNPTRKCTTIMFNTGYMVDFKEDYNTIENMIDLI